MNLIRQDDQEKIKWDELEHTLKTKREIRDFLKEKFQMNRIEIENEISKIIKNLKLSKLPTNLWIWKNKTLPGLRKRNPDKAEFFEKIIQIIEKSPDKFGFIEEPLFKESPENEIEVEKISDQIGGIVGRVTLTKQTPATSYEFYFWLKSDTDVNIEPGELIEINIEDNHICVATVEDIKSFSDRDTPISDFYGFSYGQPEEEPPTEIPVIRVGKAKIIYRSDGKYVPFVKSYPIRKSMAENIAKAFYSIVRKENQILFGFIEDGFSTLVPIFGDFNYLFGYKAAHVNITGKTGVAGKTSYALFLIASALSNVKKLDSMSSSNLLAVIGFNVKEKDLLAINNLTFENLEEAIESLQKDPETKKDALMWDKAKKHGIDPIEIAKKSRIYLPGQNYSYGLQDLFNRGVHVFLSLFESSDIDDKFESLILSIIESFRGPYSFSNLKEQLYELLQKSKDKQNVYIGGIPHHVSTINKFLNRINKIIRTTKVLEIDSPFGHPLNICGLDSGDFWIIDINQLKDNEKRMVFLSVLSDVSYILEEKKSGSKQIEVYGDIYSVETFPSRVAIFVDELNKFAPSTRSVYSPIKNFLVDIAARGRSIGLSLIGAEQFASQIDDEILGNVSTYLIGKN
jgi:hypothetical protein